MKGRYYMYDKRRIKEEVPPYTFFDDDGELLVSNVKYVPIEKDGQIYMGTCELDQDGWFFKDAKVEKEFKDDFFSEK